MRAPIPQMPHPATLPSHLLINANQGKQFSQAGLCEGCPAPTCSSMRSPRYSSSIGPFSVSSAVTSSQISACDPCSGCVRSGRVVGEGGEGEEVQ